MASGKLLNKDEERRLVNLIGQIEQRTTGEIRIHIAKHASKHGILSDAAQVFKKLGMDRTRERNAVLLLITIKDHGLACIGDKNIHELVGDDGWKKLVEQLTSDFAKGDFYLGLHKIIEGIGAILTKHFPLRDGTPPRSLPDDISY